MSSVNENYIENILLRGTEEVLRISRELWRERKLVFSFFNIKTNLAFTIKKSKIFAIEHKRILITIIPVAQTILLNFVALWRNFSGRAQKARMLQLAYVKPRTSFKASGMHPFSSKLFTHGNFERSGYGGASRFACNIC